MARLGSPGLYEQMDSVPRQIDLLIMHFISQLNQKRSVDPFNRLPMTKKLWTCSTWSSQHFYSSDENWDKTLLVEEKGVAERCGAIIHSG